MRVATSVPAVSGAFHRRVAPLVAATAAVTFLSCGIVLGGVLPAHAADASTAADVEAAFAAGTDVTLTDNVLVPQSLTVKAGAVMTVDLGGFQLVVMAADPSAAALTVPTGSTLTMTGGGSLSIDGAGAAAGAMGADAGTGGVGLDVAGAFVSTVRTSAEGGGGGAGGLGSPNGSDGNPGTPGADIPANAAFDGNGAAAPSLYYVYNTGTLGQAASALPTGWPARTGYTLTGWFTSAAATQQIDPGTAVAGQTSFAGWSTAGLPVTPVVPAAPAQVGPVVDTGGIAASADSALPWIGTGLLGAGAAAAVVAVVLCRRRRDA